MSITQKGITHNLVVLSSQTNKLVNVCVQIWPKGRSCSFQLFTEKTNAADLSTAEPVSMENRWEVRIFHTQTSLDHKDIDAVS